MCNCHACLGSVVVLIIWLGVFMVVFNPLSAREKEILVYLCQGLSNKEIAGFLNLSENTIRGYSMNLLRKLNAKNRIHAVSIAHQYNLL